MDWLSRLGIPRAGQAAAVVLFAGVAGVAAVVPVGARRAGGTIAGVVTTKAASLAPIRVTIDPNVCGDSLPDEAITVDASGHARQCRLCRSRRQSARAGRRGAGHERKVPLRSARGAAPSGGTVKMMSKDPMLHTMHARQRLTRARSSTQSADAEHDAVAADRQGRRGHADVQHAHVDARLPQVTEELAGLSGADGKFRIDGVPAGTHELRVWHEALKTAAPVKVTVNDGETVDR